MEERAFRQFRRLLVGVVVEVLGASGLPVDLGRLEVGFEPDSGFRFRWVDNWMRFHGWARAPLVGEVDPAGVARVHAEFEGVWPEIVGALHELPLADRLDVTRQVVSVTAGDALEIRFDLEAD